MNNVKYFDGDARAEKTRYDCLYDFGVLYRELACVVYA